MENSKRCFEINVSMIRIPADHSRRTKNTDSIAKLARSFTEHGQLQPILVKKNNAVGFFEVVAGKRRLEAAIQAGFQTVTCMLKDESNVLTSLEENLQREKLDPLDKADAYHRAKIEMGCNQKEIAEKLGKSEASVSATLSLRDLAPEIKTRHRKEKVLSEKQLLIVGGHKSLEEQLNAYERALTGDAQKDKRKKCSSGNLSVAGPIKSALISLRRRVESPDFIKLNPAEVADICALMLSLVARIISCAARMPNFDQQAVLEIIRAQTLALHQAIGRFDLSQVNVREIGDVCDQLLSILSAVVKSQFGRAGFNPIETLTAAGQVVVVLAQLCGDKTALRTFRDGVGEIASTVRKIYGAKFSALKFLRKFARWA